MIKSHAKVKIVEKADISNPYEFFENYDPEEHKGKGMRPLQSRPNQPTYDEDGTGVDGVVEKAKSNYIDQVKKSETGKKQQSNEKAAQNASKLTNGKSGKVAQNQSIPNEQKPVTDEFRRNDDTEFESEISSRRPGYLDADLEQARLAARTRDLKDLFEKWNYDNNVYDNFAYNDSIPEYEEIDDSQIETTKTLV